VTEYCGLGYVSHQTLCRLMVTVLNNLSKA